LAGDADRTIVVLPIFPPCLWQEYITARSRGYRHIFRLCICSVSAYPDYPAAALTFSRNRRWKTTSEGKPWRGELINQRKDGAAYTEEMTITPVRDVSGCIASHIAIK
jgi:hypothetical protein